MIIRVAQLQSSLQYQNVVVVRPIIESVGVCVRPGSKSVMTMNAATAGATIHK